MRCRGCWPDARVHHLSSAVVPSFILLAVQGPKIVTFVYEIKEGQLEISKSEFTKRAAK